MVIGQWRSHGKYGEKRIRSITEEKIKSWCTANVYMEGMVVELLRCYF